MTFGSTPATCFDVISDHRIEAVTPPHSPEAVFVTVTTCGSCSSVQTHDAYFVFQGDWQAYIGNRNSFNVTDINTSTDTFTTVQTFGISPSDIAITPNGEKALVSNQPTSDNVNSINTATNTFANIPVGNDPFAIAITPNGTKAYVANLRGDSVSVINIATNTLITTIPTEVVGGPIALTVTPNGKKVYVLDFFTSDVIVIDTGTDQVIATISLLGPNPLSLLAIGITPDGTKAYVSSENNGVVFVIDIASDTIFTTIPLGLNSTPLSLAITPDGKKVYVISLDFESVFVIDTAFNTVIATIPSGGTLLTPEFKNIMITPDGKKAYVTNRDSNNVGVIDTSTNTLTTTIANIGTTPVGLAITPDGKKVYVINFDSDDVAVINTINDSFITIPAIGDGPFTIAITPDQAPLAKFRAKIAPPGCRSKFDASESVSPVGTIVNYFWDFGDGSTLNTSSPCVSHTYANLGDYTVTLIVTNSAGTSTTQILNPSSTVSSIFIFFNQILGTSTVTFTHNGGPSAQFTKTVSVSLLPPQCLRGCQKRKICSSTKVLKNILTWRGSFCHCPHCKPVAFRIYRDECLTKFVGEVSAECTSQCKFRFVDKVLAKRRIFTYFVVSVDKFGNISQPAKVIIER